MAINIVASSLGPVATTAPASHTSKFVDPQSSIKADNRESALRWSKFGFVVLPVEAGSAKPTVVPTDWRIGLDEETIDGHWTRHPEHHVAFILGSRLVVVVARGRESQAALLKIEEAFDVRPNFVIKTPSATQSFFRLKHGTRVAPAIRAEDTHSGHIDAKTGNVIVVLPPHGGRELALSQASSTSDFTVVGQDFVDAIHAHNSSCAVVIVAADKAGDGIVATTPTPTPVIPPIAPVEPVEGGKGGETGGAAAAPDTTPAFTGITTFGSPVGSAIVPAVAPLVNPMPPAGPVEGGKGGESGAAAAMIENAVVTPVAAPAITPVGQVGATPLVRHAGDNADDVFLPKAAVNPVVAALKEKGLYLSQLATGDHAITCPWAHEHAAGSEAAATYTEPDERNPIGFFHCFEQVHEKFSASELLELLGVTKAAARDKPVIRVLPGELHRVIDAAEMVLAARGRHYQYGGLIASISIDPATGDASILPTSVPALTRELSVAADWEVFRERTGWVAADPSSKHVSQLHSAQGYRHLPALAGVARQPYFRETDGMLVTQPGYDPVSKRYGIFDPAHFVIPEPTLENAQAALGLLKELLAEFSFKKPADKSAALSGMFTATVRISLAYAPAFHVTAPVSGSGKSYLSEVMGAFAGPALNVKVSYPTTSEEATKMILSLLVTGPAVIEFDDMTIDWLAHGVINRMLTSEWISDRILGVSKVATVSTRTFVVGSGNNVGPVVDADRKLTHL